LLYVEDDFDLGRVFTPGANGGNPADLDSSEQDRRAGFDAAGVAKIGSIGDDVAPPLFGSVLI
jgi:hypothetical protein